MLMRGVGCCFLTGVLAVGFAQDRIKNYSGYREFVASRGKAAAAMRFASAEGEWRGNDTFLFLRGGSTFAYKPSTNTITPSQVQLTTSGPVDQLERGRQYTEARSSNGLVASYSDGQLIIRTGIEVIHVARDANGVRFGTAGWVYGEEFDQQDAMGWSPNGASLWYYRYDDSKVEPNHVLVDLTRNHARIKSEPHPLPGAQNPQADLMIFDLKTRQSVKVAARPGDFDDGIGHYVYGATWRPDSAALLFHRLDRRQKTLELCAADPKTGTVRALDRQSNSAGFVEFAPLQSYSPFTWSLGPNQLVSLFEDSGYFNIGVIDLDAGKRRMITNHRFDVLKILRVDPEQGEVDYLTDNSTNPYHQQLWRSRLDGSGARRITDPKRHHSVWVSPDGQTVIDRTETPTEPPVMQALTAGGKVRKELDRSDAKALLKAGFTPSDLIRTVAKDGKTAIYGRISKPRNFDPKRRYPVLVYVYGGPLPISWYAPTAEYRLPVDVTNLGFLFVEVYGRGSGPGGRAFRQALYGKLGGPEIDDMASIAMEVARRPYADAKKVGIFGASYGGYAAAMALLRYPSVFAAASSSAAVTDWRQYDSIYTERYMGLPADNPEGYRFADLKSHVGKLRGDLMLYFGMADDNTYLNGPGSLIEAFSKIGKSIEVQIGADQGHSQLDPMRMMEFFIERMVLKRTLGR